MDKEHTFYKQWPIQIRFNDIDPMGHVNNATLQEYFDLGRMYYLNLIFNGKLHDNKLALLIASIHTDFLIPIFLKDEIQVQTKIYKLGNKSLKMIQQLIAKDGTIKASSKSAMVCFQIETNETQVIPEYWREKVREIEQSDLK